MAQRTSQFKKTILPNVGDFDQYITLHQRYGADNSDIEETAQKIGFQPMYEVNCFWKPLKGYSFAMGADNGGAIASRVAKPQVKCYFTFIEGVDETWTIIKDNKRYRILEPLIPDNTNSICECLLELVGDITVNQSTNISGKGKWNI